MAEVSNPEVPNPEDPNPEVPNPEVPVTESFLKKWIKIFSFISVTGILTILGTTIENCNKLENLKFNEANKVKDLMTSVITTDAKIDKKELFIAMIYDTYKGKDEFDIFTFWNSEKNIDKFDLVLDFSEIFINDNIRNISKGKLISENELYFFKKIIYRIDTNYWAKIRSELVLRFSELDTLKSNKTNAKSDGQNGDPSKIDKKNSEIVSQLLNNWTCYIQVDTNFRNNLQDSNEIYRNNFLNFIKDLKDQNVIVPKYEIIEKSSFENDIRYFYLEDKPLADKTLILLKENNIDAKIKYFPIYRDKIPKRQIEVWISEFIK